MGSYSLDAVCRPDSAIDISCLGYLASIESHCTHGVHFIYVCGVDLPSHTKISPSLSSFIQPTLLSIVSDRGCFSKEQANKFSQCVSARMKVYTSFIVTAPTSIQGENMKTEIENIFRSLWKIRERPVALRGPRLWREKVLSELLSVERQYSQRESVHTAAFQVFQLYRQSFEQCNSRYFEYCNKMIASDEEFSLESMQAIVAAIHLTKDILLSVLDIDKTHYITPSEF